MFNRFLVSILVLFVLSAPLLAQGERKVLLIGNADYGAEDNLAPTTRNDANAVYSALVADGLDPNLIKREFNLNHDGLVTALEEFSNSLRPEDKALFYFSGHGFSLKGENYIVPIGFRIGATQTETENAAVSLTSILNRLLSANTQIIILDACRDEPDVIKNLPKGLNGTPPIRSMVQQQSAGTLIAYAAASGKKADAVPIDGNSLYTHYLVQNLRGDYGDLQDVLDHTRRDVTNASNRRQNPGLYNDLQGDFPLKVAAKANSVQTANVLDEATLTESVRRNISRETVNRKIFYKFRVWSLWLDLSPALQQQVVSVHYTFPDGYLKGSRTRVADLNSKRGLTSWFANTCGEGTTQVDVELAGQKHVSVVVDLCKVVESSDPPAKTT